MEKHSENLYVTEWVGAFLNVRSRTNYATAPRPFAVLSFRRTGESVFTEAESRRTVTVRCGDVLYIPPRFAYQQKSAGPEELIALHFNTDRPLSDGIVTFKGGERMEERFDELLRLYERGGCATGMLCTARLYEILYFLILDRRTDEMPDTRLTRALTFLSAHYVDADISVDDIARAAGVSRTKLGTLFAGHTGMSPALYLRELRLWRAREYLSAGYYSVREVAHMCGFRDEKYFATVFRRVYGVPPSHYATNLG